jgi:hypothetical protein
MHQYSIEAQSERTAIDTAGPFPTSDQGNQGQPSIQQDPSQQATKETKDSHRYSRTLPNKRPRTANDTAGPFPTSDQGQPSIQQDPSQRVTKETKDSHRYSRTLPNKRPRTAIDTAGPFPTSDQVKRYRLIAMGYFYKVTGSLRHSRSRGFDNCRRSTSFFCRSGIV